MASPAYGLPGHGFLRCPRLNDLRCRDLAVRGGGDGLLPGYDLIFGGETGEGADLEFGDGMNVSDWRQNINDLR